ncbi:PAS domain-containing sensor histidine kinase [Paracoccus sp. SCSIO 75233]|uniref:sensor histidine kinase NtrY-like n=1 Tax=Paracoccus sp. SCSIO 75233 TaxID=3017782 RepID=UPI0022F13276|nr:PAS domain-containing sensor histidine kinase [Paracoccus sp. SCSIO 75233]WBU54077.1 PAS domain-containing sensor histidine kinase [Paracoccus sp. SCSIO 75233]
MAASGLTTLRASRLADRLARVAAQRRLRTAATLVLVVAAPVLALLTIIVLGTVGITGGSRWLSFVLVLDFAYMLVLLGLVLMRLAQMAAARRRSRAGSRLHSRLVGIFALIAMVPTVLVALFAGLVINIGLEGWFSNRVREVVTNAQSAAIAYQQEHREDLSEDALNIAAVLRRAATADPLIDDGELRVIMTAQQSGTQRGLREAYVIDAAGSIHARGERSYDFWYVRPSPEEFDRARADGLVLIEDWDQNAFRALVALPPLADRFLYVARDVDGRLLSLLDDTRETISEYRQLEQDRGRLLFEFSLVYLGFALLLIAAAMWLALWFAERLSRPIGRLAEASERVGEGDLDLQIPEADTGDEIQTLGQSFNRMTRQLKAQRDQLVEGHRASEEQRRLFDSVLSSITAGVIGLDENGEVDFMNRSAMRMVGVDPARDHDRPLGEVVPEFAPLLERLSGTVNDSVQDEIRLVRDGHMESLLVRLAMRHGADGGLEGYVVAFDDVTELVSAQRMAAWGDVARRVAHEIKNPLTPIQLSAERMRRKFSKIVPEGEERASVDSYVEVIIRQTNDLRRIIDEFSRFARMPEPDRRETDIAKLLRDTVLLQEDALRAELVTDIPTDPVRIDCDATMMAQVFTNLLKNASEAIDDLRDEPPEGWSPRIDITLEESPDAVAIRITDNGPGLPEDRTRLFEPYVTLKSGGTGLGLPIVKKIVEEHGGSFVLTDAPERGALAELRLPRERNPVRIARKNKEQDVT